MLLKEFSFDPKGPGMFAKFAPSRHFFDYETFICPALFDLFYP